jgi:RNA polymerase sigma-70 factor, ECF subfamily
MTEPLQKFPQTIAELSGFIRTNQNRLVRHAFFRLGNKEEAEDVVQEVMIRIYQERESRTNVENPLSYVFRMVYNACIDRLRKSPVTGSAVSLESAGSTKINHMNREQEIIAREEYERLNRILKEIPGEQAEVIRLRIFDELSFTEISELLKVPVTTIKSRFSYGITKLRNHFLPKEDMKYEMQ